MSTNSHEQMNDFIRQAGGSPDRYWKSLEELSGDSAATESLKKQIAERFPTHFVSRRDFMEWMGGLMAVLGLSSCTRGPQEKIIPYVKAPENVVPGKPLYFATAMSHGGAAMGLLVESHMGRPTKIEGNPEHPASLGSTDAFAQAAILDLYDPDRAVTPSFRNVTNNWANFAAKLTADLAGQEAKRGAGLRILTETVSSPTLAAQFKELLTKYPQAKWIQYDAVHRDAARAGAIQAFGEDVNLHYRFDQANVVLSLDADFLSVGAAHVRYSRDFAKKRSQKDAGMNRLYAIECTPNPTGSVADHRWSAGPKGLEAIASAIARGIGVNAPTTGSLPAGADKWIAAIANDLKKNAGASIVVPGEFQSPEMHALAAAMNAALGNFGKTVIASEPVEPVSTAQTEKLAELVSEMKAGNVDTLIIIGGNPVYTSPADLDFVGALGKVKFSAHLSIYRDETSDRVAWHLPQAHFLEAWSDARAYDGTVSIVQPLIAPLYSGKSAHEMLSILLGRPAESGYDAVRNYWKAAKPADFEKTWQKSVHDGVVAGTGAPEKRVAIRAGARGFNSTSVNATGLAVVFRPDSAVWDGRFSNNGWMQELPRPLTKMTWDNAIFVSAAFAGKIGGKNGDILAVKQGNRGVEGPMWILPGQPDDTLTMTLGYGRTLAGRLGSGTGYNAYPLRLAVHPWTLQGVEVTKTGRWYQLVTTQDHASMEGRDPVKAGPVQEYLKDPKFLNHSHHPPVVRMTEQKGHPFTDENYAWGMSIDLNTCSGCNACVVACQSENNIAVVGKDQVARNRELHWLRIDRYYKGPVENPETFFQPLPCMHCEQAPCEVVCPVEATSHSPDGINEMTYNRCVGTRYCSNNCPYKVRHFNFYQFSDVKTPSIQMGRNPDVTVRARGVMEKCTFCVQRVNEAKIEAKKEGRLVRDGEFTTACAQACPSQSIVFGNIKDPNSKVSKLKAEPLNYGVLEELGTLPRTTYLAKLTNPNPEITPITTGHHGEGH